MALYRPGTEETDLKKIIMSLQAIATAVDAHEAAWTAYAPVVTAQSGTPTTIVATGRYKQNGKTVFAQIDITITDKGTASGVIFATLPVTAAAFQWSPGSVFEYNSTGKSGACYIGASTPTRCNSRDASGTEWWVNGYKLAYGMTYEAA